MTVWLRFLLVCLVLAFAPAHAQTPAEGEGPDYAAWAILAEQAESAIEDRTTTTETLTRLRGLVVAQREQFLAAQTLNADRIATLREQIAALGPPPAEGETEAAEIAERRADLNQRLTQRQAPLLAADEAFRRADGIVRGIDRILRERQADALMTLWPTPVNPANWIPAANALISSGLTVYGEVWNAWLDPARRAEMVSDLPVTLGALLLALLMLVRGRGWMEALTTRLLRSTAFLRGREVAAFVVSLAQLLVPFAGLMLLYLAVLSSRVAGPTIESVAEAMIPAGMAFFVARWLALQLFPVVDGPGLPLNLTPDERRRGRLLAMIMGLLTGIWTLSVPLIAPASQPDAANAVLFFPMVVLAALTLFKFGRLLRAHRADGTGADEGESQSASFFDRMVVLVGKIVTVLALLAPILAAVGYVTAAVQIVFPAINSLALLALVVALHRVVIAVYAAILGTADGAAQALVPALAGLLLGLGSLPLLALIWGVRDTELLEVWLRFREGFVLGETRISPVNLLYFMLVFVVGYLLTRGFQGALASSVLPRTKMEKGAQKAVVSGVGYLGIVIAALVAFSTAGIDLSGLAIVAGALSVGIGFGLQNIVSNFVSGLILLIERPVAEGDWVEVGPTMGIVSRISVRSTVIETFDKTEVIVPNADLISQAVTNYTKTNTMGRMLVKVGVAYGSDTRRVEEILREIITANPLVMLRPPPSVIFAGFGADSLNFEMRAILSDVGNRMRVTSEVHHQIAERFRAEGIEIPFAQRDIWLRNPEALRPAPVPPAAVAAAAAAGAGGAAVAGAGTPIATELMDASDFTDAEPEPEPGSDDARD